MSKSTSPGADKAQGSRQEAEGKRQRDSQEIKYHISTYISQQDGKNKNTLSLSRLPCVWGVSITIFLDFHIRISIYHSPFTIFHIRYLHLQLDALLITCAHTFARVGQQLPPQQTHSSSRPRTQKETQTQTETEREIRMQMPFMQICQDT